MGKEYFLRMVSRKVGKEQLGLPQHLGDISILGRYAQIKFRGDKLPEGWGPIEEHINSCEFCQYEVSDITKALKAEEEARAEYLGITAFENDKESQENT